MSPRRCDIESVSQPCATRVSDWGLHPGLVNVRLSPLRDARPARSAVPGSYPVLAPSRSLWRERSPLLTKMPLWAFCS